MAKQKHWKKTDLNTSQRQDQQLSAGDRMAVVKFTWIQRYLFCDLGDVCILNCERGTAPM